MMFSPNQIAAQIEEYTVQLEYLQCQLTGLHQKIEELHCLPVDIGDGEIISYADFG